MTQDLLLITASLSLVVLTAILVAMFVRISRALTALAEVLQGLQRELAPMVSDLRTISLNMAAASESLNDGMDQVGGFTRALGGIGNDLEQGRRTVKGVMDLVGGSLLSKLGLFGRALFNRAEPARGAQNGHFDMR